jgi:hypothetical protein
MHNVGNGVTNNRLLETSGGGGRHENWKSQVKTEKDESFVSFYIYRI